MSNTAEKLQGHKRFSSVEPVQEQSSPFCHHRGNHGRDVSSNGPLASLLVGDIFLECFKLLLSVVNTGLQQLLPRLCPTKFHLLPKPSPPLFSPHHTGVRPFHSKSPLLGFYYCCTMLFLHLVSAVRICISREWSGEVSTMWGKSHSQVRVYAPSRHLLPLIPVMGRLRPVQGWSLQQRASLKSDIACMTEF